MTLPRRPERSNPVPNEPFNSPEITEIKGPYWNMPLGSGLEADPYGSVQTTGSTPSEPKSVLYGPNGWVGVGAGLGVNFEGELMVTCNRPPYGCNTDVNPSCVEDLSFAWVWCAALASFPLLDVGSGKNFYATWAGCYSLSSFPPLDVSSGTNFLCTWQYCSGLTSFPLLNVSSGGNFQCAWQDCTSLTTFPAGMFDTCAATNFNSAWYGCALTQTSVDNILVSLDTAGQSNGIVNLDGGTSSAPGAPGLAAKAALIVKGWTVTTN